MKAFVSQAAVRSIPSRERQGVVSADEIRRSSEIKDTVACDQFLNGRALLRGLLAWVCGLPALSFSVSDGDGKPHLIDRTDLHFSISKSAAAVAVAVSRVPIGIDLEKIEPNSLDQDVMQDFFHPEERARVAAKNGSDKDTEFFAIWTKKEAFAKALGEGMALDFATILVPASAGLVQAPNAPDGGRDWYSRPLSTTPGFCLALASPIEKIEVIYVDLTT